MDMRSRIRRHRRRLIRWVAVMLPCSAVVLTNFNTANAAGARRGMEAGPGEIVLLHDVPKRPAVRSGYPGTSLLVDVGPVRQTGNTKNYEGLVELNDQDAAVISAGSATQIMRPISPLISSGQHSPGRSSTSVGRIGITSGGGIVRSIGNVTRATDGISTQIGAAMGSLSSQIPMK